MPFYDGRVVSNEYLLSRGVQGATGAQGLSAESSSITSDLSITNNGSQVDVVSVNIPTGSFFVGMQFRFGFHALLTYGGTSGVFRIRMFVGSNPSTLVVPERTAAASGIFCKYEGISTVRSLGATGSFMSSGSFVAYDSVSAVWNYGYAENTTNVVDTTAATPNIKMTFRWATASASNSIVIKNAYIDYL
jgi:hypothetical protein